MWRYLPLPGRKRKPKQQLSYQEKKEKRILKKFGANGVALGEDEDIKTELEKGKKTQGKPRVAGSKRGRELRAAAALARFDQQKKEGIKEEQEIITIKIEDDTESETASDDEAIMDINGRRLVDKKGHSLVKVCEDEDTGDEDAQNELKEPFQSTIKVKAEKFELEAPFKTESKATQSTKRLTNGKESKKDNATRLLPGEASSAASSVGRTETAETSTGICPMCSFDNGLGTFICSICSHVLNPRRVPNSWKCNSSSCQDSMYLNAGDSGICGICGQRKSGPS